MAVDDPLAQTKRHRPKQPSPPYAILTGYGPFSNFKFNPSYESVRNLQASSVPNSHQQEILMHVLEVPVAYEKVHALAPTLFPTHHMPGFILHVGAHGGLTPAHLVLESRARNSPYDKKDVFGQHCPGNECYPCREKSDETLSVDSALLAKVVTRVQQKFEKAFSEAQSMAREEAASPLGKCEEPIALGIDQKQLANAEDASGVEQEFAKLSTDCAAHWTVQTSDDAGLYLCEYIFYHSLYWSKHCEGGSPPVFFLHVPSASVEKGHRPQEELSAMVKEIVAALCEICT
ncbi:hypothetical protein DFS34DRAFT_651522 [Phlyctochytrium arcticum]|nr:hypothetical protein DFS34DRAFT_651522 [Phlyctochytrium arcticum]